MGGASVPLALLRAPLPRPESVRAVIFAFNTLDGLVFMADCNKIGFLKLSFSHVFYVWFVLTEHFCEVWRKVMFSLVCVILCRWWGGEFREWATWPYPLPQAMSHMTLPPPPGSENGLLLFLICCCSKCCWECSRSKIFPLERPFSMTSTFSLRTSSMTNYYHWGHTQ